MNTWKNRLVVACMAAALSVAGIAQSQIAPSPAAAQDPVAGMALIPGGEFVMGYAYKAEDTKGAYIDNPAHAVKVAAFYLDKTAVTNGDYFRYCQATGHKLPFFWGMREFRSGLDFPDHPVVGINWKEAQDYAKWRGARLPTEAEWEYAARGGLVGKPFPNGDSLETNEACYGPQAHGPERVGKYKPNAYGLYDMVGNVGVWVADLYAQDYYLKSPKLNPPGPDLGCFRVVRGGGWYAGKMCNSVYSRKAIPTEWVDFNVGFRCARSIGDK